MRKISLAIIGAFYILFGAAHATHAAVTWTQHSMRDGNTVPIPIRPNLSCDGVNLYWTHPCRNNECSLQDSGSLYKTVLSTGTTTRIISSTLNTNEQINYASPNNDGSVIAFTSNVDRVGDLPTNAQGYDQIYVYLEASGTYERLTAYQNEEALHPNISCDGDTVCWTSLADPASPELNEVSQGRAYCYNRTTDTISAITTDPAKHTYWIAPNNNGTKYAVTSIDPLAGALPSGYELEPQIYFFNGSAWSLIGLLLAGDTRLPEPHITGDETKMLFAMKADLVEGDPEERRIAFQYSFESGLITRLFAPNPSDPSLVVDYVSTNTDGTIIGVNSDANLNGDVATSGQDIYSGIYTPSSQTVQSGSPVDLAITDAQGRTCAKAVCAIPGCFYFEHDFNGDGEPNDRIWCDPRPAGIAEIEVIPDGTAQPTDTYSLVSVAEGAAPVILATNETIENIPPTPYEITVPPPIFSLNLLSGRLQPRNGTLRLRATFVEPEVSGNVVFTVTGGSTPLVLGLGNTTSYTTSANGNSMRANINGVRITLKKRFHKGVFQHWIISITGHNIDLQAFVGSTDLAITQEIIDDGETLRSSGTFDRRPNGDLSFKK